jgi:hypothetical protein
VPHQQRHFSATVLRQDVLHVHLLDQVTAVGIDLLGAAAGQRDLAHRLAGDLDHAAADVERAHVAQHDRRCLCHGV